MEEGGSKRGRVKKGEVERVELWGRAHEGKALLCSYSVSGRLGDVTTTLDFPGGQAPTDDADITGQIQVSGRVIGGRAGATGQLTMSCFIAGRGGGMRTTMTMVSFTGTD